MARQHIVFLTGAGVSAESGLSTFRGKDGMWTNEELTRSGFTWPVRMPSIMRRRSALISIIGGEKSWPRWSRTMLTA